MTAPCVSVVMAAYNAEKTIAETIQSVLGQAWRDFEFIIVDDGSSDRTGEIAASFRDPRIIIISNPRNIGLAPSLNVGLSRAAGQYVARTDADDVSNPQRFEKQIEFLKQSPEVGVVGAGYNLMDENSRTYDIRIPPGDDEYLQRELLKRNPFSAGSVMMRRDRLCALGGYEKEFPTAEDYDLWLRFAERGRLAIMSELLYSWRVRPDSMTHGDREKQLVYCRWARAMAWQRRLIGHDDLGRRLELHPGDRSERSLLAEHCLVWGRQALRERQFRRATRLFLHAARMDPFSPRLRAGVLRAPAALARSAFRRFRKEPPIR